MSKKVLITGGLGFIGSHLARKNVEQGNEVTILSRSDAKIRNIADIRRQVNLITQDIRDIKEEHVAGQDYIFHLAGTVDNYALQDNQPYRDVEANCNGTIALLESVRAFNPKARIIFGSTFFVNGNVPTLPATPNSPCNPLGLYGATRLAAEHFCKIYHNVFDIDSVIARFTNVFGPGEDGENKRKAGFNYMINQAVNGNEVKVYKAGDFFRDYIYIDDVVDACQVLAEKGQTNQTYYVGRGEFVKFKRLVEIIEENLPEVAVTPITPPSFHQRVGINDYVADVSQLKNLGWVPKISLEEGIKRTIEYYRGLKDAK